jgi:predicted transcriptional regulator
MATHAMTLRLDDDDKRRVRELSVDLQLPQQEVVRLAVRALHGNRARRERFLAVADGVAADYAEPLRRLGEV